jgi:hypothetical protein
MSHPDEWVQAATEAIVNSDGYGATDQASRVLDAVVPLILQPIIDLHRPYLGKPERGCAECHAAGRMNPMMFDHTWPCATARAAGVGEPE